VGNNAALQTRIILAFHASSIGGHSGIQATYKRVHKLFHWKGLKQDVHNVVKQCAICQQTKHENCKIPGQLQPLHVPKSPWHDISMDFIVGLPKSQGFAHFLVLKHPFTVASVAQIFLDNIVKLNSFPKTIVSHRDPVFTSAFWTELFK
jgi:hypothetical protein